MALDDIAKKTGYSKASVSTATKMLENVGILRRFKHPGSRKVFFFAEKNLVRLNIQKLRAAKNNFVAPMESRIAPIIAKYKNKIKDEEGKKKLKILEDYRSQIHSFKEILERWLADLEEIEYKV